jgi:hypothetical protein
VAFGDRRSWAGLVHLVSIALAGAGVSAYAMADTRRCGPGEQPVMLAQLFFGRNVDGRPAVTDAQFDAFVEHVLARNFPQGLTHVNAIGHWQAPGAKTTRERSDVVMLVLQDRPELRAGLEAVRRDYIVRFHQHSVLMTRQSACMHL